jgi:mono/diheme cytochrome c family protein
MTTRLSLASTLTFVLAGAACQDDAPRAPAFDPVARGEYLVTFAGCNDCHTPMILGPDGPMRDPDHMLAGHPEELVMPPAPPPSGPWAASVSATFTAWNGPWGTSFTANLTPDDETGLGTWDRQTFIDTIRNGRHLGRGRPLLPPMPYEMIRALTDDDLGAIYAYLQSIPAVKNRVPAPIPPAQPAS